MFSETGTAPDRVDLSPKMGGKRLTPLAERAYRELGYDGADAKAAAEKLTARFVKKMGSEPVLSRDSRLSIYKNGAQLTVDGKTETLAFAERRVKNSSTEKTEVVRIGVKESKDAQGNLVPRGLVFKEGEYTDMRNFLERFYRNVAGYDSTAAVRAAAILQEKFVMAGKNSMADHELLQVWPGKAVIQQMQGPAVTIWFGEESLLTEKYEAERAAVVKNTQAQLTAFERTYGDRWRLEGMARDEAKIKEWDARAEATGKERARWNPRGSLRAELLGLNLTYTKKVGKEEVTRGPILYSLDGSENRCLVDFNHQFFAVERVEVSGGAKFYSLVPTDSEGKPTGAYLVQRRGLSDVKSRLLGAA